MSFPQKFIRESTRKLALLRDEFYVQFETKAKTVTPVNKTVEKVVIPANEGKGMMLEDVHHAIDHAIKCAHALNPEEIPEFDNCDWIDDVS